MTLTGRLKQTVNDILAHYGYRVERIVDYSQHGVDVLDLAIALLNPSDPEFFFIQVGAHDGRRGDPIHRFVARYHWHGLLLEPQPAVFARLVANYQDESQLLLENAAVATTDGTVPLFTLPGSTLRASFNRDALAGHASRPGAVVEIPVRSVTFRTLLRTHDIRRVDLLVIDTEGFDYQVVRMALDEGMHPRLLRYEHLHLSTADRAACATLLAAHGYRLLRDGTDTMAFADDLTR